MEVKTNLEIRILEEDTICCQLMTFIKKGAIGNIIDADYKGNEPRFIVRFPDGRIFPLSYECLDTEYPLELLTNLIEKKHQWGVDLNTVMSRVSIEFYNSAEEFCLYNATSILDKLPHKVLKAIDYDLLLKNYLPPGAEFFKSDLDNSIWVVDC